MSLTQILSFSIFFILIFSSCGNERIKMISKNSGLRLPENYEIIKNETSGVGQDFDINIVLKFDQNSFTKIIKQADSLNNVSSQWSKSDFGFQYVKYPEHMEPEEITIDAHEKTLSYSFSHL